MGISLKLIKKRIKITKKGKMLRKKAGKAHGMAKLTSRARRRYKGYVELEKFLQKKIKKILGV